MEFVPPNWKNVKFCKIKDTKFENKSYLLMLMRRLEYFGKSKKFETLIFGKREIDLCSEKRFGTSKELLYKLSYL